MPREAPHIRTLNEKTMIKLSGNAEVRVDRIWSGNVIVNKLCDPEIVRCNPGKARRGRRRQETAWNLRESQESWGSRLGKLRRGQKRARKSQSASGLLLNQGLAEEVIEQTATCPDGGLAWVPEQYFT